MVDKPDLRGLSNLDELSSTRLWKTLDSISDRLSSIERQLSEVVRLEERVNSHEQALGRYGTRLDNHDKRIHEAELWQASYGDKSSVERLITNVQQDVVDLKKKVGNIESNQNVSKGEKEVGKEVLKWLSAILAAVVIFHLTNGI